MEHNMQPDRSPTTRTTLNKTKVEYVSYLKLHENILREKAKVWFLVNGITNSTYFHKVIQDRWRRIRINKILDEYQPWVQGNANVSEAWVKSFNETSGQLPDYKYFQALEGISIAITDDINHALTTFLMDKEIKSNFMTMDLYWVPMPDGLTNKFF